METPNYYEEREKIKYSSSKTEKENNTSQVNKNDLWMDILKNVSIDAGIAVLGGGAGAAVLGQYSFLAGLALTAYAHHEKSDKLRTLGIGLMASSSMTNCAKQDPKASMTDNMTERLKAFGEELKRKLFLEKLMKSDAAPKTQTKQANDLKGTEQKKNTSSDAQNTEKTKTNETVTQSDQTVKHEADYLDPDSASSVNNTNPAEDETGAEKAEEKQMTEKKYQDVDLEKLLGIEGKLY